MGSLNEHVVIVTGAGRGIGRGIALALAKEGATTALVERDEQTVTATAAEITGLGATCLTVIGDVSDAGFVDDAVHRTVEQFGRLDGLVNNAQAMRSGVPLHEHTDDDFDLALRTGLWGTFRFMRASFPALARHGGSVVNVASSAGTHGLSGFAGYASAKEGIRGLTKVAANEWGVHGIRVNAICPQAASPSSIAYFTEHPERQEAKLAARPIKRDGDAESDIGRTVVFLLGPDSGFVTGSTLMVNGGLTIMP
jgi:NAD(P)-dependent dehydrogenase (short-subunit alcohol dehydrogenase family)